MARVAYHPEAFQQQPTGKLSRRVENKSYLDWIRELPCIVTGVFGVDAAHISFPDPKYGKLGRGKSAKESDRWAIPLSPEEHRRQHGMNEQAYWRDVGIDPCVVAMALYGVFTANKGDVELALLVIRNIERRPVRALLPEEKL